jgi:tripartite-type tricarboxylate transporter receptor subunit TctC
MSMGLALGLRDDALAQSCQNVDSTSIAQSSIAPVDCKIWVNSNHLSREWDDFVRQLSFNPGQFSYNYAFVGSHQVASLEHTKERLGSPDALAAWSKHLGFKLQAVAHKSWASALDSMVRGQVDMLYAPSSLIEQLLLGSIPRHIHSF